MKTINVSPGVSAHLDKLKTVNPGLYVATVKAMALEQAIDDRVAKDMSQLTHAPVMSGKGGK